MALGGFLRLGAKLNHSSEPHLRSPLARAPKIRRDVKLNDSCHGKPPCLQRPLDTSGYLALEAVIPARSIRIDNALNRTGGICARVLYKRRMISSTYCFSCVQPELSHGFRRGRITRCSGFWLPREGFCHYLVRGSRDLVSIEGVLLPFFPC
jgi:hypothetical protein